MILIQQGIYTLDDEAGFRRDGFFHKETRQYMPLPNKFKDLLYKKAVKFWDRYQIDKIPFTLGRDTDKGIGVITILHPKFDTFSEVNGESIVIGRIKRMRGDLKKIFYEYEEYKVSIKLYDVKDKESGEIINTIYKQIVRKRLKLDKDGEPIIRREVYFKPYNLDKRYRIKKNGVWVADELMYPYIYVAER